MKQLHFTLADVQSPERLERLLRQLNIILASPMPQMQIPALTKLAAELAPLIRSELQAPGVAPLNLQSLLPDTGLGIVLEDTHANRLTLYPASSTDVGALFWETDRTSGYIVTESAGVRAWTWFSGTYRAAVASIPVDLGTNDAGFRFVNTDTDTNTEYIWTGSEWWTIGGYLQEVTDAATAAVSTTHIERHLSTGTPAAGFGARLLTQLEDASNQTENASAMDTIWTTATSGSETSALLWLLRSAGAALAELMRLQGAGNLFLGATITTAQFSPGLHVNGGTPGMELYATGAAADAKAWDWYTDGNNLIFRATSDSKGSSLTWLTIVRNAMVTITSITFGYDVSVPDEAYNAANWNGSLEVPTKNAIRDKIETITGGETGALVSDTAYAGSWNGVTTIAPSKNAVYDKVETLLTKNGVNFGPGAVASITVVDGQVTAIS